MTAVYYPEAESQREKVTLLLDRDTTATFYSAHDPHQFKAIFSGIKSSAMDEYLAIKGGCGSDSPEIIPGKEYQI